MDNHFIAGFVSGVSQTIVGHPLDTMKVWKQNQIVEKKINPSALLRGIPYPLFCGSTVGSLQFYTASLCRELMTGEQKITNNLWTEFVSGTFSGIFVGLAICPLDRYKISAQSLSTKPAFGLTSCLMREIPASGLYFASYAYGKKNNYSTMASGSLAGLISWGVTFPIDTIKSQVQSGNSKSIADVINKIRNKQLNPWNGYSICLARGMIVNSVGFYVYEACLV